MTTALQITPCCVPPLPSILFTNLNLTCFLPSFVYRHYVDISNSDISLSCTSFTIEAGNV
ncbi:MAG: hypothetical protein XXXJIFNMEKO3_00665 [Candidatus Erwinia impunctatus]|nr:hypothetical protein XXXJIFNMEKO_00665 [Culicoides impunctatus]